MNEVKVGETVVIFDPQCWTLDEIAVKRERAFLKRSVIRINNRGEGIVIYKGSSRPVRPLVRDVFQFGD